MMFECLEPKLLWLGTYWLMIQHSPLTLVTVPMLAFTASCFLDTMPIAPGPAERDAASPTVERLPAQATTDNPEHDAGTTVAVSTAVMDAGMLEVTAPAPPMAASGLAGAASVPPIAASMADAGKAEMPSAQCAGLGSYGLRAAIDVTWDATPWFEVGRGTVEVYGVVRVAAIDPQTHRASSSFQLCGLSLPTLNSSALCSRYQLQLPQSVWDEHKLPEQMLDATYYCDASRCTLQFSPASYSMGIQLADANAPWPALKDTTPAQFPDIDADGLPGVSMDVVSVASVAPGQNVCTNTGGPTGSSNPWQGNSGQGNSGQGNSGQGNSGQGNSGQGNPGRGNSGSQSSMTPAAAPSPIGQLPLGMRTQLTAAIELAADCELQQVDAGNATLNLRAAGCLAGQGSDAATANLGCSEELRAQYDQTLPSYHALAKGELPSTGRSGSTTEKPSAGTTLKAVRFAPGTPVDCSSLLPALVNR